MNIKKLSVALALGAVLVVGVVGVSADPGRGGRGGERPVVAAIIQAAVDATGQTAEELATGLRSGSTLADLVTDAGGDVQAVIDAAVAAGQERIDTALSAGRLTQEQATAMSAQLTDRVTAAVNGELGGRGLGLGLGRGGLRMAGARELVSAVADATGLNAQDIVQQWHDGSSLNEIATANGVDPAAIVQTAVTGATAAINQAVTDGRITQDQADQLLANLSERFTEAMSAVHDDSTTAPATGNEGVGV